ncbi:conserved hypothetical protein [Ricinus communis]|uniref:DUF4228 domain-containing protein n=1 Tax=Ricinus communis TaxID=3988 RepID=B9SPY7_RICCO|nr:conserved hypothetical protein [Ricinus communis]|eukprot:XP_002528056.1 uncharacterized protein LOC8265012 [Ricinus communis]
MGNYMSSKLANPIHRKSRKSTKVVLPTGEIRKIRQPTATKAAELMMDVPGFFVVNTKSLKIGKRFYPLSADDDLEKGNVYVMYPMYRKNSVVTAGDMVVLFVTANKVMKRGACKGNDINIKVLPESQSSAAEGVEDEASPRLSLEGIEHVSTPQFRYRMSISRSKKPLLETIQEESICSR